MEKAKSDLDYDYECSQCGAMFRKHVWSLDRSFQRVHYETAIPEVEIEDSESLACYCSPGCMELHTPEAMRGQGVPIPAVRPGLDPVEACVLCKGPVDMSDFHLTY